MGTHNRFKKEYRCGKKFYNHFCPANYDFLEIYGAKMFKMESGPFVAGVVDQAAKKKDNRFIDKLYSLILLG